MKIKKYSQKYYLEAFLSILLISSKMLSMESVAAPQNSSNIKLQEIAQINFNDPDYIPWQLYHNDKSRNRLIVIVPSNSSSKKDMVKCYDYNGNYQNDLPIELSGTTSISSMDGNENLIVIADSNNGRAVVWDLTANKVYAICDTKTGKNVNGAAGLGKKGDDFWLVCDDGSSNFDFGQPLSLFIWNLSDTTKPVYSCVGHKAPIQWGGIQKPKGASWFVSNDLSYEIRTWDFKGNCLAVIDCGNINQIRFAYPADNIDDVPQIVVANNDIRFYLYSDGVVYETFASNEIQVNDVDVSSDKKTMVSGDSSNRAILWDIYNNKIKATFNGSMQSINGVKIIPELGVVITASGGVSGPTEDNAVRVWDLNGNLLDTSSNDPAISSTIHNLGNNIIIVSSEGFLRFFKLVSSEDESKSKNKLKAEVLKPLVPASKSGYCELM